MSKEMKPKGPLFTSPMVRAILDGRKSQTRRLLKPQPIPVSDLQGKRRQKRGDLFIGPDPLPFSGSGLVLAYAEDHGTTRMLGSENFIELFCPYPVGSVLYVKETFAKWDAGIVYLADCLNKKGIEDADSKRCRLDYGVKWKSSRFMPRDAARIWLEVTAVSVERVQQITEDDAKAEGVECPRAGEKCGGFIPPTASEEPKECVCIDGYVPLYGDLWESLHGPGSWEANPFVFVYTFKRIERPKDL